METTRARGGPVTGLARAVAALIGVCCAAFLLSPWQIGVLAFVAATGALLAPRRRITAIGPVAALAFMAFMFGPTGAGGFVLMQALTLAPLAAGLRGVRPVMALTLATAVAAMAAACAAAVLVDLAPTRWAAFAPMAPAFALAAPAFVLRGMVSSILGSGEADARRLNALGPLLVALVVGAGLGGLEGAAVGWAIAQLSTPLAMLLLAGRRTALAPFALGVLAAGFVATLATGAALAFAGGSQIAAVPAVTIGLAVYVLALRVHAPPAARRLARALRAPAVTPTPTIAPAPAPRA